MTDAIGSLVSGAARARGVFDDAAVALSSAMLPMEPSGPQTPAPGPDESPVNTPPRDTGVDVADQMVTMMVASHMHGANIAALRSALDMYKDVLDLVRK